jgi:hypothetical protein
MTRNDNTELATGRYVTDVVIYIEKAVEARKCWSCEGNMLCSNSPDAAQMQHGAMDDTDGSTSTTHAHEEPCNGLAAHYDAGCPSHGWYDTTLCQNSLDTYVHFTVRRSYRGGIILGGECVLARD